MTHTESATQLRRAINLPLLTFYGVGVTVGAGIFALIGEVLRDAGDHAPLAFLIAGLIASATGVSYARLATVYPRAGGEAVYAKNGLGNLAAIVVGYGVTITGIISSAVIAVAFGNYLGTLIPVPADFLVVGVIVGLATIACLGVRESVAFATVITLLEVGTLAVVAVFGAPLLGDALVTELFQRELLQESSSDVRLFSLPSDIGVWTAVSSTVLLAFFAFVGFEDIVNMAEETKSPQRTVPRAVILTLLITVLIYALIASIAVLIPDRTSITSSAAPMAAVYSAVSGRNGAPVSAMASIAMVNGILVQIVMASRVIYGMTREQLAPAALGHLHRQRQTPVRAIVLISGVIVVLALAVPLGTLAKSTSLVILCVFTLVNISLWRIGSNSDSAPILQRWRWWGVFSALLCVSLLAVIAIEAVI